MGWRGAVGQQEPRNGFGWPSSCRAHLGSVYDCNHHSTGLRPGDSLPTASWRRMPPTSVCLMADADDCLVNVVVARQRLGLCSWPASQWLLSATSSLGRWPARGRKVSTRVLIFSQSNSYAKDKKAGRLQVAWGERLEPRSCERAPRDTLARVPSTSLASQPQYGVSCGQVTRCW